VGKGVKGEGGGEGGKGEQKKAGILRERDMEIKMPGESGDKGEIAKRGAVFYVFGS